VDVGRSGRDTPSGRATPTRPGRVMPSRGLGSRSSSASASGSNRGLVVAPRGFAASAPPKRAAAASGSGRRAETIVGCARDGSRRRGVSGASDEARRDERREGKRRPGGEARRDERVGRGRGEKTRRGAATSGLRLSGRTKKERDATNAPAWSRPSRTRERGPESRRRRGGGGALPARAPRPRGRRTRRARRARGRGGARYDDTTSGGVGRRRRRRGPPRRSSRRRATRARARTHGRGGGGGGARGRGFARAVGGLWSASEERRGGRARELQRQGSASNKISTSHDGRRAALRFSAAPRTVFTHPVVSTFDRVPFQLMRKIPARAPTAGRHENQKSRQIRANHVKRRARH
jgi:hypothetical protein